MVGVLDALNVEHGQVEIEKEDNSDLVDICNLLEQPINKQLKNNNKKLNNPLLLNSD